ncbi:hypothetical protein SLEP1_g439 [Rubroshorea leprosula]|uniref:CWF19-like protein 2 n=1 Tax=Rubroshorea leprosula TaxID=152421 RepID=A0AAV5HGD2_9ROSI|nr:hypothetical protein SLEP1_g439 [Rubroshorea leprosula]
MLGGIKFIPRDQIDKAEGENPDAKKEKSSSRKEKAGRKKKAYISSDDEIEKIDKGSRKKKWYSSDEYSSSQSESEDTSDQEGNKRQNKRRNKRSRSNVSREDRSKKGSRRGRKQYSSDDDYSTTSEDGNQKSEKEGRKKGDTNPSASLKENEIVRKEMGLDWMLRPADKVDRTPTVMVDKQSEEPPGEVKKVNPREMNPYLKDNGSGYPEEADEKTGAGDKLLSSSLVGDGGASWKLKALKRAQEQAAREGRNFQDVVEERWGSLGKLAVSAASHRAAPFRAHLHAIKNRKQGQADENQMDESKQHERYTEKNTGRDYLRDVSLRHSEMKAPKVRDSLSWGKRKGHNLPAESAGLVSAAVSGLNKFANDGNFIQEFLHKQSNDSAISVSHTNQVGNVESEEVSPVKKKVGEGTSMVKEPLTTNQLAAKALQLRMKGKHEEAERLLQEVENMKAKQGAGGDSHRQQNIESTSRYVIQDFSKRKGKEEDDGDMHLARKIMQNKQYGRADDEYDYDDGPSRKSRKKGRDNDQVGKQNFAKRILPQQERCLFCFENPNRPKHLVTAIANFTYLMLPQWQSVVPGHCCILPMQHESSTRTLDDNVWEEIRNFKKCLIMMFAKQEKEVVFLETVIGLAQQRRHCLIECIPLPREIAKQAPLYFKKAIDEAEDEWSQHNAKKLIDTSKKGLRGSIPKNFPYFHVEFGLDRGFVHVIDDEKDFKSSLGLNVIRGMLQLPEEDMYRRRRHESVEMQKQAVASFVQDWEPFDWTKQLD